MSSHKEHLRAVVFDAGNTLIHVDPRRMVEIFREHGADLDEDTFHGVELEARRVLHEGISEGLSGTEPEVWRGYFLRLFSDAGVPREAWDAVGRRIRDVHREDHLWTGMAEDTPRVLTQLADRGYRLAVVSNADGRVEAVLDECGLGDHFEFVLDSEIVGVEKPDPEIFREALRLLELPAGACLYVGDLYPVDYLGATGAGMQAVLLDPLGLHRGRAPTVPALSALPRFIAGGDAG